MENVDLHCHTNYSDGILSPKEVVRRAKEKGIKYLAITDHNSVDGVIEAVEEGKKIGVNIVPGVEIKFKGGEILGYFIDSKNKELNLCLNLIKKQSLENVANYCMELNDFNYSLTFEKLKEEFPNAKNNLNKYHVCYFLFNHKYFSSIRKSANFVFGKKLKSHKKLTFSLDKLINIIKNAGGVPVLAHPWINEKSKSLLEEPRIEKLVSLGLKGIEIDQGDRNERRDENFIEKIKYVSKKYNLILTSGSDFHGDFLIDSNENSFNHEMGSHNCDEEVLINLRKLSMSRQEVLI